MPKMQTPATRLLNETAATNQNGFFEKNINPCSKSKSADKLLTELQKLMTVCRKNLYHSQELQKQAYNKSVKPESYTSGNSLVEWQID